MAEEEKKKRSFKPSGILTGDRPLPHDNNAEVAVLGSILLSPEDAIDVGGKLPVVAFYNERHRVIFKTLMALHSEPEKPAIDLITLIDSLRRRGDLNKAGGEEYLIQVMNSMPTAANIEAYTEIVMENYILRRLISSGSDIIERSFSQTTSVKELMDQIEQDIMEIGNVQAGNEYLTMGELMPEVMMHIKQMMMGNQEATGLDSGFVDLNKMIYGFRPQNMIVLAARPSIGKTALALNFAANIAIETSNPKPVGIFSLEMSAKELATRLLISTSRVGIGAIKNGNTDTRSLRDITEAATRLKNAPIYIDDTPQIDILELRAKCRRMKRDHDIQMVIIDYLQLMTCTSSPTSSREQEVARMSGAIKAIAKELDIPVMVLAQLNRQAEQAGQRPKLSHLRESGSIEQDADIVMILHRERDAQHEADEEQYERGLKSEIIIAKHRAGATGLVPLVFMPKIMRFVDFTGVEDSDVPR